MSGILYQATAETNVGVPSELRAIKSPELSYEVATLEHSQPYFTQKAPKDNGARTHVIQSGSTTDMAFVFSSLTYNLSEFVLHYKAEFKNEGKDAAPALDGFRTYPFASVVPIQTVELKGQNTGEVLWRLNNASPFLTQISKLEATKKQLASRTDIHVNRQSYAAVADNKFYDGTNGTLINNDFKYIETPIARPADDAVTDHEPLCERYLRFGDIFKYSPLAADKMWFPTEPLELTITWMSSAGWACEAKHATDITTTPQAMTPPITLTNVYVDMCIEQSGTAVDRQCRELAARGAVLFTPTVVSESRAMSASSDGSIEFTVNPKIGKKLSKVFMIPTLAAPTANLRYDYSNVNGARVESYQTAFKNVNIQPVAIQVKDNIMDWNQNRKYLEESAMWNIDVYRRNWCIIDDFSGCADEKSILPFKEDSIFVGKDIEINMTYNVMAKVGAAAINMIAYFVGSQKIIISPVGLKVVS